MNKQINKEKIHKHKFKFHKEEREYHDPFAGPSYHDVFYILICECGEIKKEFIGKQNIQEPWGF